MFYKVVKNINYNGYGEKDLFRQIDFAVLSRTKDQYNFKVFYRKVARKLVYFIYGKYRCAFFIGVWGVPNKQERAAAGGGAGIRISERIS